MARAIIFHSLAHARAALTVAQETGAALCLMTAPDAARYAGPDHLKKICDLAFAEVEGGAADTLIDCGEDAGSAMAALRAGWNALAFSGDADVAAKLADMAGQCGARLAESVPQALDLIDEADPEAACRRWLSPPD